MPPFSQLLEEGKVPFRGTTATQAIRVSPETLLCQRITRSDLRGDWPCGHVTVRNDRLARPRDLGP
jgi:hypothetical protein